MFSWFGKQFIFLEKEYKYNDNRNCEIKFTKIQV